MNKSKLENVARRSSSVVKVALFGAASCLSTAGCAAEALPEDGEAVAQSEDALLAGRKISEAETAQLLRSAGFPESVVATMVCTAKYESAFYERASNRNSNGTIDRGLFQINSIHAGTAGCPSGEGLYDAAQNARCAYQIYKSQGINAWYGYQAHRSECNSYRVAGGGGGGGACWSPTLGRSMPAHACVQSRQSGNWFQCEGGEWGDRWSDPNACSSVHPL